MSMKIYLDLVFFINFMFDFLLLLTVKIILKRQVSKKRILLGSLVGALSIFFLFLPLNSITLFLLKVIISLGMTAVTFGIKDRKMYFKDLLYLYFSSIILGGFLYYLNLEFSYQNTGLIFFHNGFSINFVLLLILSPIILYLYMKQERELKTINNYYYKVELFWNHSKREYLAYLDTGNKLYDPYFHKPIILLYDPEFDSIENPIYIPYQTLEHSGLLEGFKADKIILNHKKTIYKPLVALSKDNFQIEGIKMLLHKDYLD